MVKEKKSWIIKTKLTKAALALQVALLGHQQGNLCSEHQKHQMNQGCLCLPTGEEGPRLLSFLRSLVSSFLFEQISRKTKMCFKSHFSLGIALSPLFICCPSRRAHFPAWCWRLPAWNEAQPSKMQTQWKQKETVTKVAVGTRELPAQPQPGWALRWHRQGGLCPSTSHCHSHTTGSTSSAQPAPGKGRARTVPIPLHKDTCSCFGQRTPALQTKREKFCTFSSFPSLHSKSHSRWNTPGASLG